MTPHTIHLSSEAFANLGAPDLVYVRPIKAREVLSYLGDAEDSETDLDPDQTLYAVHRADGARLAVLLDHNSAIAAALSHDLAPVSVH
ncbi:MAG: hypothetical protein JWM33_3859 [Caulobacteraceae bacterium]|nr:hypothetical protein [Caulobacteraceae bacterium]